MERNPLKPAHAERGKSVLVLEPSGLPLGALRQYVTASPMSAKRIR
jgi:hypothetical protein